MNCIQCNADLKEGAKFCGKCGTSQLTPAPEAAQPVIPQPSIQATNTNTAPQGDALGKIKDRIFWNIQAGELARRFNETQMAENDGARGIVINEGTTAFIKANGELIAELHGGAYDFLEPEKLKKVLDKREGGAASGIKRGFITHLQLKGIWEKLELTDSNISVEFNVPTNFYEMRENQRLEQRGASYSNIASNEFVSKTYAQKKYLQWKDKDILANREFLRKDAELQWEIQQITTLGPAWREQIIATDIAGGGAEGEGMIPQAGGSGGAPPAFGGGEAALGADASSEPPAGGPPAPETPPAAA